MKPSLAGNRAAQAAVAAIVLLGLLGGSLILAQSGFTTAPKRGGPSVFVPAPQAYVLAVLMYGMSAIGLLALLRAWALSALGTAAAALIYLSVAVVLVFVLHQH